jgi:hypothetical protein
MAEDAKGTDGITKTAGDVAGRLLVHEEGTQGFVLALHGELRREEEVLVGWGAYLIHSTGLHIQMMLQEHSIVNMFWKMSKSGSTLNALNTSMQEHRWEEMPRRMKFHNMTG